MLLLPGLCFLHALAYFLLRSAHAVYITTTGNTCIIVAYHDDKIQPGSCRSTAGKLADFLKENNI